MIIEKSEITPNLKDYELTYATFNWQGGCEEIEFFADNKLNAAYNAVDRHLHTGRANKVALYAVSESGHLEKFTFAEIASASNRLANGLHELGIKKGDRVFVFLPRIPELYISTIAIAKLGAIAGPLFSAFGPDALRDRLVDSGAKAIITSSGQKKKLDEISAQLTSLKHIIMVDSKVDRQ
jgi:acetyl-CoA synthetase